jgi:hypothetical protein
VFEMLGPIAPQCKKLLSFGFGSEERAACFADPFTEPTCVIVLIGRSESFEKAVFDRTGV